MPLHDVARGGSGGDWRVGIARSVAVEPAEVACASDVDVVAAVMAAAAGPSTTIARAAPEAAVALNLTPEFVRDELPGALAPVVERVAGATESDAKAALMLLRRTLRDAGGRNIPALAANQEQTRVRALVSLSRRLGKARLVPAMTIHQAKGREWTNVAVHLRPAQVDRLAAGLREDRAGDRELYVALTRAVDSVRLV